MPYFKFSLNYSANDGKYKKIFIMLFWSRFLLHFLSKLSFIVFFLS
ncbi:hypothetical protein CHCC14557_0122 [Bacillus licheniformis]|nr:hypothetical protein CHCC14557_0122 [Bacillus licheniformis]